MAKLELVIDIKELMDFYKKGLEDGFMLANNGNESDLEKTLNINKIDEPKDGEE